MGTKTFRGRGTSPRAGHPMQMRRPVLLPGAYGGSRGEAYGIGPGIGDRRKRIEFLDGGGRNKFHEVRKRGGRCKEHNPHGEQNGNHRVATAILKKGKRLKIAVLNPVEKK